MKSYLIYNCELFLFKSSVEELIEKCDKAFIERAGKSEEVDPDEMLTLEDHEFPLYCFLQYSPSDQTFFDEYPEFKPIEDSMFDPIGKDPSKKIMVYNPYYTIDTGDEPQDRYSFFLVESVDAFRKLFQKEAETAFKKDRSIIIGRAGFCTSDHIYRERRVTNIIYPSIEEL